MMYQAALGEASHFNRTTPFHDVMYRLMGLGAMTLTAHNRLPRLAHQERQEPPPCISRPAGASLSPPWPPPSLLHISPGHGPLDRRRPDRRHRLALFHWSTTGGDLRVPHFAALHIMQAVPLIAWFWPDKRIVGAALAAGVTVVIGLSAQALMGIPLFRI